MSDFISNHCLLTLLAGFVIKDLRHKGRGTSLYVYYYNQGRELECLRVCSKT
jgi:hypothetical protein